MKTKAKAKEKLSEVISVVIHHGELKQWTGTRWVVIRNATKRDFFWYPEICRDEL